MRRGLESHIFIYPFNLKPGELLVGYISKSYTSCWYHKRSFREEYMWCSDNIFRKYFQVNQIHTAQEMKFSITDFFSKCNQNRWTLPIWSHLLKKPVMENFIFCAVSTHIKCWASVYNKTCNPLGWYNSLKFF